MRSAWFIALAHPLWLLHVIKSTSAVSDFIPTNYDLVSPCCLIRKSFIGGSGRWDCSLHDSSCLLAISNFNSEMKTYTSWQRSNMIGLWWSFSECHLQTVIPFVLSLSMCNTHVQSFCFIFQDSAFLYGLGLVYFHFNAYQWWVVVFMLLKCRSAALSQQSTSSLMPRSFLLSPWCCMYYGLHNSALDSLYS